MAKMAGKWNNENCEVKFYKDLHASTLAVDCLGVWALLAGRRNLVFIDLRDLDKPPVKVTRQSKWDIGCVQWNQHAIYAHRFVTACSQRLDVFDFREASATHLCSLKAHSRTVSDVDWSPFDVNIVASCSVDSFTYLWDVRDPKKPVKFFQTVSGAYQVKWNKVWNNLFATTHDGDVRIWDPRKENTPLEYISAHPSKIHGLDWSPTDEYKLVTASQDCTIRSWDRRNPRRCDAMINSWNPVWRARYTPFGKGIMSVVVPQIRRGENSLYLWNQDNQQSHVHAFVGHQDVVLEFQWQKQAEGSFDHHLVTWSKDQSLRIWKVDPALQKLCGHETDELPIHSIDDLSPHLHQTPSFRRLSSLKESKTALGTNDRNGHVDGGRNTGSTNNQISNGGSLTSNSNVRFSSAGSDTDDGGLQFTNGEKKEDRQSMLEKKYKVEKVKSGSLVSHAPHPTSSNHVVPMYPEGRYEDNSVPFPRTCGATFSSNDYLVVFCVPSSLKKMDQENELTPRSLSDLVRVTAPSQWMRPQHAPPSMFASLFGSPPPPSNVEGVSISDFFTDRQPHLRKYSNHKSSHGHGRSSREPSDGKKEKEKELTDRVKKRLLKVSRVQVYNVAAISPVNLYLAKHYKLNLEDVRGCCDHNAKVANKIGRHDLVQMWRVLCNTLEAYRKLSNMDDGQQPWAMTPFGRRLVEKYLSHYEKLRDVQSMAMIVCMFWDRDSRRKNALLTRMNSTMSNHEARLSYEVANIAADKADTTLGTSADSGWELLMNKGKRSRSLSESYDDSNLMDKELTEAEEREAIELDGEKFSLYNDNRMLNPELRSQYELIKRSYANILYKWGLLNQRTQVLKHTLSVQTNRKYEMFIPCSNCLDNSKNVKCNRCQYPALNCSICHIGVRGPANVCLVCGHGGHLHHMKDWFHTNKVCPSGCGCNCLQGHQNTTAS